MSEGVATRRVGVVQGVGHVNGEFVNAEDDGDASDGEHRDDEVVGLVVGRYMG